jgi:hypothetical protein
MNKFVDFVREYHFDLIIIYGTVLVIFPLVTDMSSLDSFKPFDGALL